LHELSIPEEGVLATAIDSFDVHAEGHHDLVVRVVGVLVFDAHFDSLV
jgi:hypothetical protein